MEKKWKAYLLDFKVVKNPKDFGIKKFPNLAFRKRGRTSGKIEAEERSPAMRRRPDGHILHICDFCLAVFGCATEAKTMRRRGTGAIRRFCVWYFLEATATFP
jgi:hypothetical protein